jgi:SAM-dependent methyltransferase
MAGEGCYSVAMSIDAEAIANFYAGLQGRIAARLVGERLAPMLAGVSGMDVLGIGYAAPFLPPHQGAGAARRCVAVTPAQAGVAPWPRGAASLSCTAEEDALPFPDLCFDRVLLVHGLEAAENSRRMLREAWRVLKDDGRLIVVAPNRRGMWAHVESTPFGQGQPYSPGQIGRLLRASLFAVERRDTALYMPPLRWRIVLRGARLWEQAGRVLAPQLAGVTITEASKDLYGAIPVGQTAKRRLVLETG